MILLQSVAYVLPTLEVFARGGGGGSSSGGGGSGGSIILLIGYVPTHFVSGWFTRNFSILVGIIAGTVTGLIVTTITAMLLFDLLPFDVVLIGIAAAVGVFTGTQDLFGKLKRMSVKTKGVVAAAASTDPAWQEEHLKQTISQTFADYQKDWSEFNVQHIQTYTSPRYFHHITLMLAALKVMGRQNVVLNARLTAQYIADATNSPDNTHDSFMAVVVGQANDRLVDVTKNEVIYTDNSPFTEYWTFVRGEHGKWLLDGIDQATADVRQFHNPIRKFALDNGMFYSLDWGWLLLPRRGKLFGKAKFKFSDINNHVIGQWNGILVQLYTYRPYRANGNNYQIAQITLPKSYGGIIIRRKHMINMTPKGYQKVTFEWPDFNRRYTVYTTDMERVTSFELLNPKFMADLYDMNLKVEIEVVDNVVYLYSKLGAGETRYPEMMQVLQHAFRELKL